MGDPVMYVDDPLTGGSVISKWVDYVDDPLTGGSVIRSRVDVCG